MGIFLCIHIPRNDTYQILLYVSSLTAKNHHSPEGILFFKYKILHMRCKKKSHGVLISLLNKQLEDRQAFMSLFGCTHLPHFSQRNDNL